ncbi:MAG: F0F1 ATP synthase subunit B, partial [Gammaproteobacteria bacterium]|nr:F0F1 ATP synthase subunit B [Gammaproteobacteria bacterium]
MDINATLIGQTIAMIVFVWFCMKYIWPPLLSAIEERQEKIAEGLAAAEQGELRLEEAKAQAGEIVDHARKQATGILDQAHARANEIVAEGKADGVKERERQLSAAKAEI